MSREAQALPAARAIDVGLRKITETLASELAQPSSAVPQWSEFEWNLAEAVAAMHGISPLLSRTLRWRGPPSWTQFLEEQRSHTLSRHVRIEALLHTITAQARDQRVGVIALKGAALHTLGLYEGGDRPMADVDLLVRPDDAGKRCAHARIARLSRMLHRLARAHVRPGRRAGRRRTRRTRRQCHQDRVARANLQGLAEAHH